MWFLYINQFYYILGITSIQYNTTVHHTIYIKPFLLSKRTGKPGLIW